MINKGFTQGDIIYHHTENNPWVVVFKKFEGRDGIVGYESINLNNGNLYHTYYNDTTKELRLATQEERELLFGAFPELRNKYQPIEPQYEIY